MNFNHYSNDGLIYLIPFFVLVRYMQYSIINYIPHDVEYIIDTEELLQCICYLYVITSYKPLDSMD